MKRETLEILMWIGIILIGLFVFTTVVYVCAVLISNALSPVFSQIEQEGLKSIFESIWYGKEGPQSFIENIFIGAK